MDRRMWVFILLLLIGGTIVVTRVIRNGAREEVGEPAERRTFMPATSPSAPKAGQRARTAPAISPKTAAGISQTGPSQPQAAAQPARGACPSCGTKIATGAKFCGECGHRLAS